ncbi:hypothetical protein [Paraburkholderia sp. BL21I4N1]|uniref:hypothetical protein n=1 Tax=Paraburkholderia sp. BL21I4N1 TaxID=1938801 RepID=UPI000CFAFEFB|nr:hypothetical protein [Paraburkholderia sp. BL21I4N1]PQV46634.1 hypothetical protein B0G83_11215 [Paraburkholderia sp. BL21I4N1]
MNASPFDASDLALDAEVQAQLCAYNAAFDELGLRFRWDVHTLASLAAIEGEREQIAAYIEAHHAHLLNAYSAAFLSEAILEKKRLRYPACLLIRAAGVPSTNRALPQHAASGRRERLSFEMEVPALAGI